MKKKFRILLSILTLLASLVFGTITVDLFKHQFNGIHNVFDSLYFTVVTYATLGSNIQPETTQARMLVIFLIMMGVGSFATILALVVVPFIENKIKKVMIMVSKIENISDHVVVFGVNPMSLEMIRVYLEHTKDLLVVTQNHLQLNILENLDLNYLVGDATCKTMIEKSGAVDAQTIVCCLENDASNLLLLMMIQDALSDHTRKKEGPIIIVTIQDPANADKAKRNGAHEVIIPALLAVEMLKNKQCI
jgi:voltage-gated potassium channel